MAEQDPRALLRAAEKGDLDGIARALARGIPVDPVPDGADSPLVLAVMFNQPEATRVLLEAGANVRHAGQMRATALHYAVEKSLALTKLVLARKPDLMARDSSDNSVLDRFIAGAGFKEPDLGIIDALLEAGFDLSARGTLYVARGRSPLAYACSSAHLPTIERLIAAGLELNEGDPPGGQALSQALSLRDKAKQHRVLVFLAKKGLAPNSLDGPFKRSLITELVRHRDVETVRYLLEHGADPNQPGVWTQPLVIADEAGDAVMRDLLLEFGARPLQRELAPEAASSLEHARANALEKPDDGALRLAHARALARAGFSAAAAAELEAAERRGTGDRELGAALVFTNPDGRRWQFVPFEPHLDGVAPSLEDGFIPGARVTDGEQTLPLVLAHLRRCTACDAEFTEVCSECSGTGTRSGFLNPDHEYECEPRQPCSVCGQSGFAMNTVRKSDGACKHPTWKAEAKGERFTLERCVSCGVPGVSTQRFSRVTGCAICGRIACACPPK